MTQHHPTELLRFEHADARDDRVLVCLYDDLGIGPMVVFDGGAFMDPDRLRLYAYDMLRAADGLAQQKGAASGQEPRRFPRKVVWTCCGCDDCEPADPEDKSSMPCRNSPSSNGMEVVPAAEYDRLHTLFVEAKEIVDECSVPGEMPATLRGQIEDFRNRTFFELDAHPSEREGGAA